MKLLFLGTGTSGGVPQIGCNCRVCRSSDPRDRRLRTSALLESDIGTRILIDCGPDFREQMMRCSAAQTLLSAILITHHHYDHIGGLDDLRPLSLFSMPIYVEPACAQQLHQRLPYCFVPSGNPKITVPSLNLQELHIHAPFCVSDIEITPIRVLHGKLPIAGFVFNSPESSPSTPLKLAYITDMSSLPDSEWPYLEGIDTLVVNALHHRSHPSHMTIEESIRFAQRVGARQTYFVHMSHYCLPHAEEEAQLPPGIHFAYDGLQIQI